MAASARSIPARRPCSRTEAQDAAGTRLPGVGAELGALHERPFPVSSSAGMAIAVIGLGANLGDPPAQLAAAVDALRRLPGTKVVAVSSLYRTAPLGYASQPDFVNAAAVLDTGLEPRALLDRLRGIETAAGRERSFPNAPRLLDLDLLLYDDRTIDEPGLAVPHPRLADRAFALAPLVEIAPDAVVPGRGRAADLLARIADQRIERVQ